MPKGPAFITCGGRTGTTFSGEMSSEVIDDYWSEHEPDVVAWDRPKTRARLKCFGWWHMIFSRLLGLAIQVPLALCLAATNGSARGAFVLFRVASIVFGATSRALPARRRRTVILATSPEGSRGDSAMLDTLLHYLARGDAEPVIILSYKSNERHAEIVERYGVELVPLQLLIVRPWFFVYLLARTRTFRFIGADVIDGAYGTRNALLRLAVSEAFARAGADAAIISCSYSTKPDPDCAAMLRSAPKNLAIVARDPVSRGRIENLRTASVVQGADLTFLMEPSAGSVRADDLDRITAARRDGKRVVAFGVNALLYNPANAGHVGALAELIGEIASSGVEVVLVPHDDRGATSDVVLAARVLDALRSDVRARVFALSELYAPRELKFIASQMDAIVSARMHFAIAGLSQGIPAFGLRYQGKFEGLYSLLDLDLQTCLQDATDVINGGVGSAQKVLTFLATADEMRVRMLKAIESAKALAMRNISVPRQATHP